MINKIIKPFINLIPENNRAERIWKLAQVDFKKRYYNNVLGLLWALLNPLLRVWIYYFIFTKILDIDRAGITVNYAIYLFSGIIIWQCFVEMSKKGMKILYTKKYLIQNIEVQKIDLFISLGLSITYGFMFNLMALIIAVLLSGIIPGINFLIFAIIYLSIFLFSLGFGMLLSVIYVFVRDIQHFIDILFIFGFWTSGIFFRGEKFLEIFPPFFYLNPFVGIIINSRAVILNYGEVQWDILLVNLGVSIVMFVVGFFTMKRYSSLTLERL